MNHRLILRSVTLVALAAAVALSAGCNSRWFRRTAGVVGEEAAYATLQSAMLAVGVHTAGNFVDAVRMVVDRNDYAGAAAAFAVALNLENARVGQRWTADQVIALMRLAEPSVRGVSPRVANGVRSFCDYVGSH